MIRRWLHRLALLLSAALVAAAAWQWHRSYSVQDRLWIYSTSSQASWQTLTIARGQLFWERSQCRSAGLHVEWFGLDHEALDGPAWFFLTFWKEPSWLSKLGIHYGHFVAPAPTDEPLPATSDPNPWHYHMVGVPFWLLILVFAMPWLRAGLGWIRRRSLTRAGRCPKCGYDLRATPTRCPECGSIPVTP
jgi:hypothetical protein